MRDFISDSEYSDFKFKPNQINTALEKIKLSFSKELAETLEKDIQNNENHDFGELTAINITSIDLIRHVRLVYRYMLVEYKFFIASKTFTVNYYTLDRLQMLLEDFGYSTVKLDGSSEEMTKPLKEIEYSNANFILMLNQIINSSGELDEVLFCREMLGKIETNTLSLSEINELKDMYHFHIS